ncbi:MAG: hypothetical protein IT431_00940 [Phycisphaerales bacterium]|nr:hypothetical protein [Phycisphaerales bacterium]
MARRSIAGRVARLEARPGGPRGPCPSCRGFGRVTLVDGRKGQTAEAARGCPSCGKISTLIVLDGGEGEPGA